MEEKKSFCALLPTICFIISLAAVFHHQAVAAEMHKAARDINTATYCNIFYIPPEISPASFPKSFLGIGLGSQKAMNVPSPYRDAVYVAATGILKNSPAYKAGLQKDDVILSLNDKLSCREDTGPVEEAFRDTIERLPIGSEVRLAVLRNDKILFLTTRTAERPQHDQPEAFHPEVPHCSTASSLLKASLLKEGALPLFHQVINGLYDRSNQVHNINSTFEMPYHPLQSKEMTYMLRNPLISGFVAKGITSRLSGSFDKKNWSLEELLRGGIILTDVEFPACKNQPREFTFPMLVQTLEEAAQKMRAAASSLTARQKSLVEEKALDPWDDKQWDEILELSLKVDRKEVYGALSCLALFLTNDQLTVLKEDLLKRFNNRDDAILYQAETSAGPVIVGGFRSKVYEKDAALILDLGGHNLYMNNAGGTRPGMPVAMVIDWGGHNRYVARDNFSQGGALFGGGFLIDLVGSSTFVALDGSQGAGFWGVGLLYHAGNSVFQARKNSQGVGQMGVGWLVDQKGHNSYSCMSEGQALGLYGGAGIIISKGGYNIYRLGGLEPDHRDPLKSTVSMGQGFGRGLMPEADKMGVPGGMGVLIDENGNNIYIADYFAQGSSYYFSVGILDSRGANNQFIAGRYAQGAGIHSSVGVLLNQEGDSKYFSSYGVSQGMGHDYGIGFLQSNRGVNDYHGGVLVQGAATRGGMGILVDPNEHSRYMKSENTKDFTNEKDCLGIVIRQGMQVEDIGHAGKVMIHMKQVQESMVK